MRKLRGIRFLPKNTSYAEIDSPVGRLTIIASAKGLHAILWDTDRKNTQFEKIINGLNKTNHNKIIHQTKEQLNEYFQGKRKSFDLPLVIKGTDFQIQVWKQLVNIPYSITISYAQLAKKVGNKNKARAVGMANGLNPISIIIPCHRVIGSDGQLVGFGGGIETKASLLKLEQDYA